MKLPFSLTREYGETDEGTDWDWARESVQQWTDRRCDTLRRRQGLELRNFASEISAARVQALDTAGSNMEVQQETLTTR